MDEQHYTLIIYEHSDKHGRFIAFEIDITGKRPQWVPAGAARHTGRWPGRRRECIFSASRVANPTPDSWERVIA